ncbi:leucyl-tRNA synthetase [Sclerotinia borealis F-4128]|uniref:leucine--tRNA ligase n=1 Tax=Sclerotinia borealis (strain F-4128) TaxID=1432307 RepID=W9CML2_SCLBF|nr:leucyl-tRNA synthetase [Sclerotinia borealis F-4128]
MAAVEATAKALENATISKTKELKGTEKRDKLIAIERKYQAQWEKDGIFQPDAPSTSEIPLHSVSAAELREQHPKFFGTMAYPYMNGTLHAGHSFTVSKVEFTAGFARMQGKRTLFPMGFHLTGLPIKACADKLVNEIKLFGKNFENYKEEEELEEKTNISAPSTHHEDVTKFTAKKGKAAAKVIKMKYQFQIMRALGIPMEDIYQFADPQYWGAYFSPLCKRDLTNFGARIDWRRSFVTTDANPYYDSFVRWQMNRLKELKKIKFGKRYTIYSPKDGQPCMDHDRSDGEGVGPQDYLAMKLKVMEWAPEAADAIKGKLPADADVFFVAATLRPETMYGQNCCFVGPKITYGVFKVSKNTYFVITDRAARNMSYQNIFPGNGTVDKVAVITGSACVGTLVHAPLSVHKDGVRILPMESVLPTKGTGVVTCVPSDSPDDYATIMDLAKKADYYGIKKEWAELEIISVITTPSYGDMCAPFLVNKLKIASPKDKTKLEEAKELAYKEGYYQGTMSFGEFKGEKVEVTKPKVRKQIIDACQGFAYSEPERKVTSRSGDECCVALMDQWYLDYGEESWRKIALEYVDSGLNTYSQETKNGFEGVLNWLNQWACARTYGLGSKLPWDPQFLVESLSDSTIYMAYYTIAHYLHNDIFGKTPGLAGIKPEQMTDEIWDYVFARRDISDDILNDSKIPQDTLASMRREFEYWYPLDLRVSGKDLIPNHLTFFLYIHIAIFPPEYWPKAIRANGHLLLNGEKMSKSTGNFMTLFDMINKYGADASRIALADAGDGVADANFEEDVADNNVLRLFTLREWCEDMVKDQDSLRTGEKTDFLDALFENEMNAIVHECRQHYEATDFKLALKSALYDFTAARDFYREASIAAGIKMHKDLILQYIELQALLLTVIAPHWSEYIWLEVLHKTTTIQNALYPTVPAPIPALSAARDYVRSTSSNITSAEAAQQKKKAKGKDIGYDLKKPKKLTIFSAAKFPAWQQKYIDLVRESWNPETKSANDKELNGKIAKMGEMKKAMPFVQTLKRSLQGGEVPDQVFERKLAFDEKQTLKNMVPGLKKAAGLAVIEVVIVDGDEGGKKGVIVSVEGSEEKEYGALPIMAEQAVPGFPTFLFENVEV